METDKKQRARLSLATEELAQDVPVLEIPDEMVREMLKNRMGIYPIVKNEFKARRYVGLALAGQVEDGFDSEREKTVAVRFTEGANGVGFGFDERAFVAKLIERGYAVSLVEELVQMGQKMEKVPGVRSSLEGYPIVTRWVFTVRQPGEWERLGKALIGEEGKERQVDAVFDKGRREYVRLEEKSK